METCCSVNSRFPLFGFEFCTVLNLIIEGFSNRVIVKRYHGVSWDESSPSINTDACYGLSQIPFSRRTIRPASCRTSPNKPPPPPLDHPSPLRTARCCGIRGATSRGFRSLDHYRKGKLYYNHNYKRHEVVTDY